MLCLVALVGVVATQYGGHGHDSGHNQGHGHGHGFSSQHINRHDGPAEVVYVKGDGHGHDGHGHGHGHAIDYYVSSLESFREPCMLLIILVKYSTSIRISNI